jgi:hypothetical protein
MRQRRTECPPQGGPAPHKVGCNAGLYRWPCAKANSSPLVSKVSLMYEEYSLSALYTPEFSLCQHPIVQKNDAERGHLVRTFRERVTSYQSNGYFCATRRGADEEKRAA